mmetsp:Transcript_67932/g.196732  ORF Transcript_67932/g.196732 Transcript_67932/m.196732 type:complete len:216 (+) Transcript_67932:1598-2245(+)
MISLLECVQPTATRCRSATRALKFPASCCMHRCRVRRRCHPHPAGSAAHPRPKSLRSRRWRGRCAARQQCRHLGCPNRRRRSRAVGGMSPQAAFSTARPTSALGAFSCRGLQAAAVSLGAHVPMAPSSVPPGRPRPRSRCPAARAPGEQRTGPRSRVRPAERGTSSRRGRRPCRRSLRRGTALVGGASTAAAEATQPATVAAAAPALLAEATRSR